MNLDDLPEFENETAAAMRKVAVGLGILVYLAVLTFTGVHNITLMTLGIAQSWRWAAILGVIALEISAIALPLGLHYWAFTPGHRMALIGFYIGDFALLFANTLIDYALVSGQPMPAWGPAYLAYFAPASPLYVGVTWAILLAMDPRAQREMKQQSIRASINMRLMSSIERATTSDETRLAVQQEAIQRARLLTAQVLASGRRKGKGAVAAPDLPAQVNRDGHESEELDPTRASKRPPR